MSFENVENSAVIKYLDDTLYLYNIEDSEKPNDKTYSLLARYGSAKVAVWNANQVNKWDADKLLVQIEDAETHFKHYCIGIIVDPVTKQLEEKRNTTNILCCPCAMDRIKSGAGIEATTGTIATLSCPTPTCPACVCITCAEKIKATNIYGKLDVVYWDCPLCLSNTERWPGQITSSSQNEVYEEPYLYRVKLSQSGEYTYHKNNDFITNVKLRLSEFQPDWHKFTGDFEEVDVLFSDDIEIPADKMQNITNTEKVKYKSLVTYICLSRWMIHNKHKTIHWKNRKQRPMSKPKSMKVSHNH